MTKDQSASTQAKSRLTKGSSESNIRPSKDFECFGITKKVKGVSEHALSLKLILKNGSCNYYFYHELLSPIAFNGSDEIEILTHQSLIKIQGNELQDLAEYLAEHRVVWVKENASMFRENAEKEKAAINSISIQPVP